MRVNEIITEAPVGMFKQGLRKLGAAALGAVGAKNTAASLAQSAEQGDKANAYRKEFDKYMTRKGLRSMDADYSDLTDFIAKMGLPRPNIPKQGPIDATDIDSVFKSIAKMPGGASPTSTKSTAAQPGTSTASAPAGQSATPTQAPAATPAAPTAKPGTAQPAAKSKVAPAGGPSADPYDGYKGKIRQLQSTGTKQLPDKMVASLNADMAKLAKGDKNSGIYAADKIIKFANAGYDVSKLQQQWQGMAKAGERFLTQSVYREITAMLAEHGLKWADLGLRVRIDESVSDGVFISYKPNKHSLDFVM